MWLVAVGVLPVADLFFLSSRFDASALPQRAGWLAGAGRRRVRRPRPGRAAAARGGAARRYGETPVLLPALRTSHASAARPWGALAGHLAGFGILVLLGGAVFDDGGAGTALLGAWIVAGLVTAALWVAALIPGAARRGPGLLLAGTLVAGAGLGLLAAGAAAMTREWWEPLGRSTMWTAYWLLRALGFDVGVEPERFLVGTPAFVVEITPYCSGYQGVGLMWVFLGAYLWLFRGRLRFPRALWLLPLGTAIVWLLNAVRIAVLVIIGDAGHPDVAMQGFHYHAGTLLFCATALGIGGWAASSRSFGPGGGVRRARADATAAYVLPLVALLATSLVTGATSRGGFDVLYGMRVMAAGTAVWCFRTRLAGAGWRPSWIGAATGVVAFAIWLALAGPAAPGEAASRVASLGPLAGGVWIALRLVGSMAIVPLVEELAFRGYLARRLSATGFDTLAFDRITWTALVASSLLFGMMHHDVLAGAVVGLLYGLVARRTGRLGDAVLAHAVTNALLAAARPWTLLA